jgi:hypothetical protein
LFIQVGTRGGHNIRFQYGAQGIKIAGNGVFIKSVPGNRALTVDFIRGRVDNIVKILSDLLQCRSGHLVPDLLIGGGIIKRGLDVGLRNVLSWRRTHGRGSTREFGVVHVKVERQDHFFLSILKQEKKKIANFVTHQTQQKN